MGDRWTSVDGRWKVEAIVLNGRPCFRTLGPGMRQPEYLSLAELQLRMGEAFATLQAPAEDGEPLP